MRVVCLSFRFVENNTYTYDQLQNFHDSNFDGVTLWSDSTIKMFNLLFGPGRQLSFTKDRIFVSHYVFHFQKNSILKHVFNEKLQFLHESNLIQFWFSKYMNDHKMKSIQNTSSILHIENIFGILQIMIGMYLISLIVFVLELISKRYSRVENILDFFTY